jgi:hypothetical protein
MNPNYEQPDLSLPSPKLNEPVPQWHETAPVSPENTLAAQQPPSPTPATSAALPPTMPTPAASSPTDNIPITTPVMADDSDLIEKEWVEKAKAIVANTRDDPFVQSREVSRFKADYIKKRYNKDIKVPET